MTSNLRTVGWVAFLCGLGFAAPASAENWVSVGVGEGILTRFRVETGDPAGPDPAFRFRGWVVDDAGRVSASVYVPFPDDLPLVLQGDVLKDRSRCDTRIGVGYWLPALPWVESEDRTVLVTLYATDDWMEPRVRIEGATAIPYASDRLELAGDVVWEEQDRRGFLEIRYQVNDPAFLALGAANNGESKWPYVALGLRF